MFNDLQDKEHPYQVGDSFPREGIKVSDSRLAELAGVNNKRGMPLIALEQEVSGEPLVAVNGDEPVPEVDGEEIPADEIKTTTEPVKPKPTRKSTKKE